MANVSICPIDGCDKKAIAAGYCDKHYRRWKKYGDPLVGETISGSVRHYYESVVVPFSGDECLIWPYAKNPAGYGKIFLNGKLEHVHRAVCREVYGEPSDPTCFAAHLCGKGHLGCCNPIHLTWASPSENSQHRVAHGTSHRGEKNPLSKLTESQVLEIRSLRGKETEASIAARFGVSRGCISGIQSGARWAWLKN